MHCAILTCQIHGRMLAMKPDGSGKAADVQKNLLSFLPNERMIGSGHMPLRSERLPRFIKGQPATNRGSQLVVCFFARQG